MTSSVRRVKGVQKKLRTFAAKSFFSPQNTSYHGQVWYIRIKIITIVSDSQDMRWGDVYIIRFAFALVFFALPFSIHCISS